MFRLCLSHFRVSLFVSVLLLLFIVSVALLLVRVLFVVCFLLLNPNGCEKDLELSFLHCNVRCFKPLCFTTCVSTTFCFHFGWFHDFHDLCFHDLCFTIWVPRFAFHDFVGICELRGVHEGLCSIRLVHSCSFLFATWPRPFRVFIPCFPLLLCTVLSTKVRQ